MVSTTTTTISNNDTTSISIVLDRLKDASGILTKYEESRNKRSIEYENDRKQFLEKKKAFEVEKKQLLETPRKRNIFSENQKKEIENQKKEFENQKKQFENQKKHFFDNEKKQFENQKREFENNKRQFENQKKKPIENQKRELENQKKQFENEKRQFENQKRELDDKKKKQKKTEVEEIVKQHEKKKEYENEKRILQNDISNLQQTKKDLEQSIEVFRKQQQKETTSPKPAAKTNSSTQMSPYSEKKEKNIWKMPSTDWIDVDKSSTPQQQDNNRDNTKEKKEEIKEVVSNKKEEHLKKKEEVPRDTDNMSNDLAFFGIFGLPTPKKSKPTREKVEESKKTPKEETGVTTKEKSKEESNIKAETLKVAGAKTKATNNNAENKIIQEEERKDDKEVQKQLLPVFSEKENISTEDEDKIKTDDKDKIVSSTNIPTADETEGEVATSVTVPKTTRTTTKKNEGGGGLFSTFVSAFTSFNNETNDGTPITEEVTPTNDEEAPILPGDNGKLRSLIEGILLEPGNDDGHFKHQQERQLYCTTKIRKLLSSENWTIQWVIDSKVIIPRFIEFLSRDDNNAALQLQAVWAITNITAGTNEQTQEIIRCGTAIPKLCSLLSSSNQTMGVSEQAIWALSNIAGDSADCRDMVLRAGAMGTLLKHLKRPPLSTTATTASSDSSKNAISSTFLRNASWALRNFCGGKPRPNFEIIEPALLTLVSLLSYTITASNSNNGNEEITKNVCWALSYVTGNDDPVSLQAVFDTGVVPRLIEVLSPEKKYPVTIQSPALIALGNIVADIPLPASFFANEPLLPNLMGLLSSSKHTIRKDACWTLSNITAESQDHIQAVISVDGMVPALLRLFDTTDHLDIRKEIMWVLSNALEDGTIKQIRFLVQPRKNDDPCSIITSLCNLIKTTTDTELVTMALEGLKNIIRAGVKEKKKKNPMIAKIVSAGNFTKDVRSNQYQISIPSLKIRFFMAEDGQCYEKKQ